MSKMNKISAMSLGLLTLGMLSSADLTAQEPNFPANLVTADPLVSLEFAGGSLAKFAAALRKASNDVNIVIPALAAEVDLPALALSNATVESALKSIEAVISDDFQIRVKTHRSQFGKPVYAVSVYDVRLENKSKGASTKEAQLNRATTVAVLSLKFLTSTDAGDAMHKQLVVNAETILSAVDTGLGIHEGVSKPELRYHQDSGLLFVKGLPQELGLVREIISNLESDIRRMRDASQQQAIRKRTEDRQAAKGK